MKSLVYGCAAAALWAGLATAQAHAEIVVREAPVHAVPIDEDDAPPPPPAPRPPEPIVQPPAVQAVAAQGAEAGPPLVKVAEPAVAARAEPSVVKALMQPKAPPAPPALTPEENAFFGVLGQRVTDAASAYESYVRRVAAIDPAFTGAVSVQRAVKAGAAYQPRQLQEGIVAYAALVALRNARFVDAVRAMDPRVADGLAARPEQILRLPGAAEAASDIAGVLRAQGAALSAAGKAVTRAAYDIQAQGWSKNPVAEPKAVLQAAKDSAEAPRAATAPSKERLLASLVAAPQVPTSIGSGAPDVVRGLALAAMAILGHTGDDKEAQFDALLHDASSLDCLKMAKMNLNQCLAVAGPQYEDVYCAGRHALADTGKCMTSAIDGAPAVDAAPAAMPIRQQQAAGYGPEQAEAYGQALTAPDLEEEEDDVAQPAPRRYAEVPCPAPAPAPRDYARNDYPPAAPAQPRYAPQPAYPQQPYPQPYQQPYSQPYAQPYAGQPPRQDEYAQPQAQPPYYGYGR
jgi:hypothetical protein